MAEEIVYAGEQSLSALSQLIKQAIAEGIIPSDPDQPIVMGTDYHDQLKNLELADQHPIGAITGLEDALGGIQENAHDINVLREQNNIEHNVINRTLDNLANLPADVANLSSEVNQNGSKIEELEGRPVAKGILTEDEYSALPEADRDSGLYFITKETGEGGGSSGSGYENVYSTEEVRIGTWVYPDGSKKPLYRKVFIENGHVFESGNYNPEVTMVSAEEYSLFETIVNLSAFVLSGEVRVNVPDVGISISGTTMSIIFQWSLSMTTRAGIRIIYNTGNKIGTTADVMLTVEYTKTTDEPEVMA